MENNEKFAVFLVDVSEHTKKGDKARIVGKDVLVDGIPHGVEKLVNSGVAAICEEDVIIPVYDTEYLEKVVNHSIKDAEKGRFKFGGEVIVFDLDNLTFRKETIDSHDNFNALLITGMVLPSDSTPTKALRRVSNINKAYSLMLSDYEIEEAVLSFDGWYEKPAEDNVKTSEDKVSEAICSISEAITKLSSTGCNCNVGKETKPAAKSAKKKG